MAVHAVAHLNFRGEAREALEFYRAVFGGEIRIATYGDFGMPKDVPGADRVVFGQVTGDNGFQVMAYDVPGTTAPAPSGETTRENGTTITTEKFFLSVSGDSVDEAGEFWKKLSEDAKIIEPFGPSRWAPAFGMLQDRFGVTWILQVAA
ncbi:VOC family protein [Amycolatopsis sp. WGS_07]|uniref:VOC family protein n=1 Tax=Amycolatopsis sp. WGS_07 TaxID=3076764 RepID=UPI0038734A86